MSKKAYKILYIGNFQENSVGEPEIAKCLEALGHTVTRIKESPTSVPYIQDELRKEEYDFLLFAKCRIGNPNEVERILKTCRIPVICWVFDLYYGL